MYKFDVARAISDPPALIAAVSAAGKNMPVKSSLLILEMGSLRLSEVNAMAPPEQVTIQAALSFLLLPTERAARRSG